MCTEIHTVSNCAECGDTIKHKRDYKMCSEGKKKNEWGACGMGTVEQRIVKKKLCAVCQARKRRVCY
ncbi:hypothetical protein ACHAPI_009405 [Fusarium lateritium]